MSDLPTRNRQILLSNYRPMREFKMAAKGIKSCPETFCRTALWRTKGQARGQNSDGISIRQRLTEVEDGAITGPWERDLISGSIHTHSEERYGRAGAGSSSDLVEETKKAPPLSRQGFSK